jgi:quercetin dioxygenase-like cupin family protein
VPTTDQASLTERLRDGGLTPSAWGNGPHDQYGAHDHEYDKVIVVAAGSIRFGLPERGDAIELAPGDRLEMPARTTHDAVVGGEGVTCLEAHLPAGTFEVLNVRTAGTW